MIISKYSSFVFIMFISINFSFGQRHFSIVSKSTSKNEVIDTWDVIKKTDVTTLTQNQKAWYYSGLASIYQYYKKDSVIFYLEKSYSADSMWFCDFLRLNVIRDTPRSDFLRGTGHNYFIEELDLSYIKQIIARCKRCCFDKEKTINQKKELLQIDSFFIQIEENDQRYRKRESTDWAKQNPMDSLNRILLDKYYAQHGFPILKKSISTSWFVLHHSTDCEWNKKWFIRFLDAYQRGDHAGGFLSLTFKRFYHPETGYCRKKDALGTAVFIELLKEKYPKEYGEKFGYNNF